MMEDDLSGNHCQILQRQMGNGLTPGGLGLCLFGVTPVGGILYAFIFFFTVKRLTYGGLSKEYLHILTRTMLHLQGQPTSMVVQWPNMLQN